MRDEPRIQSVENTAPEIKAAGRFLHAMFLEEGGIGSVVFHVPDPVLGDRKYHNVPVSRAVLDRIKARLERGETSEDLGDLISREPSRKRRSTGMRKRYSPKSSSF